MFSANKFCYTYFRRWMMVALFLFFIFFGKQYLAINLNGVTRKFYFHVHATFKNGHKKNMAICFVVFN